MVIALLHDGKLADELRFAQPSSCVTHSRRRGIDFALPERFAK